MHITVTKPFLPPAEHYAKAVQGIWERQWLTNNGPLVNELELQLKDRLGLDHLLFVANGTMAMQLGIKALALEGEVITTAFSYVATTSSLVWEGCKPVMVDISESTLNIDPSLIEKAITPRTTGILATHVFGNPCDVEAIEAIARRHNLKVIYDAAHGFGTQYKGSSLLAYGDIATCSFHATKMFHTVEGGAVVTPDPERLLTLAQMRNFGHVDAVNFGLAGINAKNSEFHAAMGLCNIPFIDELLAKRLQLYERYRQRLEGVAVQFQKILPGTQYNHAYCPLLFDDEATLLRVIAALEAHKVFPRRYFFPALTQLPYVQGQSAPIAESVSRRIICVPMYHTLSNAEVDMVCRVIHRTLNYA